MSEENVAATRRLYDAINAGTIGSLEELLADDFVDHEEIPGVSPTKAGVIEFFRATVDVFSDFKMDIRDIAVAGDKVWVLLTMPGTQRGEYLGVPASGRRMSVPLVDILRFQNAKVVEHWGVQDSGKMLEQLGVLGTP